MFSKSTSPGELRFQKEKSWFLSKKWRYGFFLLGILSTIWYIVRVVPKPSRASYPCVQAAAPFAAAFVIYISGFLASIGLLVSFRRSIQDEYPMRKNLLVLGFIFASFIWIFQPFNQISAGKSYVRGIQTPNSPMGIARGYYPGRVVWVWNPLSTNENCTNGPGDYWWQDENTDQDEVDIMLSDAIQKLSGAQDDGAALDSLFHYHNRRLGSGNHGYIPGEKIMVKVNICSGGWGCVNTQTYEKVSQIGMIDTSPHLILSLLDLLVNVAGIEQSDIYVGDPIRLFFDHYWDMCHTAFPDVHYVDWQGTLGRELIQPTPEPAMFYSDGTQTDMLPQCYINATYMINIGCLKQHDCAGVTFCAKNHFGSMCRDMAMHLHYALPSPTVNGFENLGYGKYRNLVDLMQHKDLGEKTMLFVVDGLWGGEFPVSDPAPWDMDPFLGDYPSSLFVSQDHVAIESVCLDFVQAEFDLYAHMEGTDDYLHQAADSANWAEGILYDPDGDGLYIASMGVHEHWNNHIDKLYSRNLGTGEGIELIKSIMTSLPTADDLYTLMPYPNPFRDKICLRIEVTREQNTELCLHDLQGKIIASKSSMKLIPGIHDIYFRQGRDYPDDLAAGIYLLRVVSDDGDREKETTIRLIHSQ